MRSKRIIVVAAILAAAVVRTPHAIVAATTGPVTAAAVWSIDPARSEVRFTVTKLGFEDVTGVFRESEGEILYDASRPEASRVPWKVKVASVLTDASSRDRSLQQREYFDAERHPYLEFSSQAVRRLDAGRLEIAGNLTMRGITRPVTLIVRPIIGDALPRFETDFTVDRYDYGITGGTVMGRLIGRTVRIHLVAAVRSNAGGQR